MFVFKGRWTRITGASCWYLSRTVSRCHLMSTFTFAPAAAVYGSSLADCIRIFANTSQLDQLIIWSAFLLMLLFLGAWFGAWPMPLDWERPWQEWPICVTYGAVMIGYVSISSFCYTRQQSAAN